MRKERNSIMRRVLCILTASALLAGSIPMKVTAVEDRPKPEDYADNRAALYEGDEKDNDEGENSEDFGEIPSEEKDAENDLVEGDHVEDDIAENDSSDKDDSSENPEDDTPDGNEDAKDDTSDENDAPDSDEDEPARPLPPGYVLSGDEKIALTLTEELYRTKQGISYEAYYEVTLSGYSVEEPAGEQKELQVALLTGPAGQEATGLYTSHGEDFADRYIFSEGGTADQYTFSEGNTTDWYTFLEDGTAEQKYQFHCDRPGAYEIIAILTGYEWDEENGQWQERELRQHFPVEVAKLVQELRPAEESITLQYGDTLNISEYVKEHLQQEDSLYSGQLEITTEALDKLQLTKDRIRAIAVTDEEAALLRVRYGGDEWFVQSQEITIPVVISRVTPKISLSLNQDSEWETEKKLQIHGDLALHAFISAEEAPYTDLLQKDNRLKLQYRIIHESSGKAQEYTQPFGWNTLTEQKTSHTVLPIGWRYFTRLHKGEQYRLELAVIYNGTDSPYELPPKQVCRITLQAANAYIQLAQSELTTEYRKTYGQSFQVPFALMHKRLFGKDIQITEKEELEQIEYEVKSSDAGVAAVEEDDSMQLSYVIRGVGEAAIEVGTTQSPTYDVEGAALHILVKNSSIREEDYQIQYAENDTEQTYTMAQWQDYVKQHQFWLKAPVTIALTDTGAAYYDTLHCQETATGDMVSRKGTVSYTKDQPVTEYTLWMSDKERNASTKDVGKMPVFSMGIDQKKPKLISVEDNGKLRYQETSTAAKWYMPEAYELKATYEDSMSGIAQVEYTTDAGRSWHAFPIAKDSAAKVQECRLTLPNGTYQGIGLRAVDVAGNVSEEYYLVDQKSRKIQIIVDDRVPELDLLVTKNGTQNQQGVEEWTNQALHYEIRRRADNPAIYRLYYQYVPVHQVWQAQQKGQKPYTEKKWQEMDWSGFEVGACNPEQEPVNRNGTYYFKLISMCGLESDVVSREIHLQQTLPELMPPLIGNDQGEQWYHAASAPAVVALDCKAYMQGCVQKEEYEAPVTIHTRLISAAGKEDKSLTVGFETAADYLAFCKGEATYSYESYQKQLQEMEIDFGRRADDIYEFSYWIEDAAGNKSEVYEHLFKIDTTPPEQLQVWLEGKEFLTGELERIVYDTFSQSTLQGEVTAQDTLSGIDSIRIVQAKKYGEWEQNTGQLASSFRIEPSTRCFLYVVARDVAGNETAGWTNGIVVDDQAPSGQNSPQLLAEPAGANDNGFYNEDVTVRIAVQDKPDGDNYAALESVSYQITSGQLQEHKELYHTSRTGISEEELSRSAAFATQERIDAAKFEGNEVGIEVTAQDRAGNKMTSTQLVKIDVTAPQIKITFDQEEPVGGRFYTTDRQALISITEKNFDAALVEWEVTRNGEPYVMATSEWSSEGDVHQATLLFTEDGEYTLSVSCRDMADNEAEPVSVEPFCMDQTRPVIGIEYEGALPHRENYYSEARIAVITIEEHNFTPDNLLIETAQPYQLLGWSHEKDTHRLRVRFSEDAHYEWSCQYADEAGNEAESIELQEFYIDSIAPVIEITGVMNDSANAGELVPVVTVREEHYNAEETRISLVNGKGEQIEAPAHVQQVDGGYSYTLYQVNDASDQIYYLQVNSQDMAGNEAQLTYRFSLNRNGSVYDMSLARLATDRTYYQSQAMKDLQIIEMNVDKVEQFEVYVSRNGMLLPTAVSDAYFPTKEDTVLYRIERQGNEQLGYVYTYTLFQENFDTEGMYQVAFYSKDAAGNEVSNTLQNKDAGLHFIIDNTPPQIVFDGIRAGEIYDAPNRKVNVLFSDNGLLTEASLSLHNDKGEELDSWDYLELAAESAPLALEIAEYAGGQRFVYRAVDAAGNELRTESPERSDFVITTNPWIRFAKSGKMAAVAGGVATAGVTISGMAAGLRYRRRRRERHA